MAFSPRPQFDWKLRSRALPVGRRTLLMAILNLTPDSFSGDGLAERGLDAALERACALLDGGADILDVGAESTRPGAKPISSGEEQDRLMPLLEAVLRERPDAVLSVDSYQAATAGAAAAAGAEIVNDVSGLQWDAAMAGTVAATGCGLVLMHTRGRPPEWHGMTRLGRENVMRHVVGGLVESMAIAEVHGVAPESMVLDPGFAFGKVGGENFSLLGELSVLHQLGRPILVGMSRKGFLGEAVRPVQSAERRAAAVSTARKEATLAANVVAILAGAHIVRVHDLREMLEAAAIADAVLEATEVQAAEVTRNCG